MLLAIDSSTVDSGLAVFDGERVLASAAWHSGRRHAEQLLPTLDLLLAHLNLQPTDLRVIAVALGPGSWSGLRVGLSLAKAVALAHDLPLVGVMTLDVLALPYRLASGPVVPVVRLGRDRYGAAVYNADAGVQSHGPIHNLSLDELVALTDGALFCGDVDAAARAALVARLGERAQFAGSADTIRAPGALAQLAWMRYAADDVDDLAGLEPLYLGSPVRARPANRSDAENA